MRVDTGADGCEERGVEQIAAHEIKHKHDAEFGEWQIHDGGENLTGFRRHALLHGRRLRRQHRVGRHLRSAEDAAANEEDGGKHHAPDDAHHELEGLHARHHELHDAVGFLLHHALHHGSAVGHDKEIDEKREDEACRDGDVGVGGAFVSVFFFDDGFDVEVALHVVDDLVELRHVIAFEFGTTHFVVEHFAGVAQQLI